MKPELTLNHLNHLLMKYRQPKQLLILQPELPFLNLSEGSLDCIAQTYKKFNIQSEIVTYTQRPDLQKIYDLMNDHQAVLYISSARSHPRNLVSQPFVEKQNQRMIISTLPLRNEEDALQFSKTIQEVHSRPQDYCAFALLSQRHKRFIRIVDRMRTILNSPLYNVYKWTSDLLLKENMVQGLERGLGLAMYFGHGRPIGWVGYYGFRSHHFTAQQTQPVGAILSLCCKTASRKRTSLSFTEDLVLKGKVASSFGAVDSTLHSDNTRWSVGISKAIQNGANTINELLLQAMPQRKSAFEHYRLIGDPFAPIYSTESAVNFANTVKTYP